VVRLANFFKIFCLGLGFILATGRAFAISEQELAEKLQTTILPFMASGKRSEFQSTDRKRHLVYRVFKNEHSDKVVIVSPGRGESHWIYSELIYDLYQAGYSVVILDHWAQGESIRGTVSPENEIQDLESFDRYAADFNQLLSIVQADDFNDQKYLYGLVAHSAGALVGLKALVRPDQRAEFKALVFTGPMMKIRSAPVPFFAAEFVCRNLPGKCRPPFQKKKFDLDFAIYINSRSSSRRGLLRKLHFQKTGKVALYPSNNWGLQALIADREIVKEKLKKPIPTLVLAAEMDSQVIPEETKRVADIVGPENCQWKVIPGSTHDLWTEPDRRRLEIIDSTLQHLKEYLR
jgi:lysophospholipase